MLNLPFNTYILGIAFVNYGNGFAYDVIQRLAMGLDDGFGCIFSDFLQFFPVLVSISAFVFVIHVVSSVLERDGVFMMYGKFAVYENVN